MSEQYCIKCRKPVPRCLHHCTCCRFEYHCDHQFKLRLGGLANGMQFRLQQLIGHVIRFHFENSEVKAKLVHVGKDYIEVKRMGTDLFSEEDDDWDVEWYFDCETIIYSTSSLQYFEVLHYPSE